MAFGEPEAAWAAAADVAAETHVRYLDAPGPPGAVDHPGACTTTSGPRAKGFYKVEPVVADGGQVVLYAPHVHGDLRRPTRRSSRSATTAGTTS